MSTPHECVSLIGAASSLIASIAAVTASVFAFFGLRTWREQLKGTSEYSLAKDLLKAIYGVREAFKYVRGATMYQYEYPESMKDDVGGIKEGCKADAIAYAYENRVRVLNDAFKILEERNLDAQVEWGAEYSEIIIPLRVCRVELEMNLRDYLNELKFGAYTSSPERRERSKGIDSIIYYYGEESSQHDKLTPKINEAILAFEERLRPIVGRKKLTKR